MPQLNVLATEYAGMLHNMSMEEYIKWRALGDESCLHIVDEEVIYNFENWLPYDLKVNLSCQLTVAPAIVLLNLYIFVRIIIGDNNLRRTFGAIAFQTIVDVVFTGVSVQFRRIWHDKTQI